MNTRYKEIKCKFCRQPAWYDGVTGRVYEQDLKTLHVSNCPRKAAHYRGLRADTAQQKRAAR